MINIANQDCNFSQGDKENKVTIRPEMVNRTRIIRMEIFVGTHVYNNMIEYLFFLLD